MGKWASTFFGKIVDVLLILVREWACAAGMEFKNLNAIEVSSTDTLLQKCIKNYIKNKVNLVRHALQDEPRKQEICTTDQYL